MGKRLPLTNDEQKEFAKILQSLASSKSTWQVWQDFISFMAWSTAAVAASAVLDKAEIKTREQQMQDILNRYKPEEQMLLADLAAITAMALTRNPAQNFLGTLYMGFGFENSRQGQFFTPWVVSYAMALMTGYDEVTSDKPFISLIDSACGSGCMLIAKAAAYRKLGGIHDYRKDILFVGQDLDPVVAKMCYIQLSLLDCAGYVIIGNTLIHTAAGSILAPHSNSNEVELLFTPMWNSEIWLVRRAHYTVNNILDNNDTFNHT